jgi:exoribonuclease R
MRGTALPTEIFPGEIVHVTSSGLVVRLLANGIEGFLDTRHSGEKFSFDNVHMRLTSASHRFELEQPIDVTVSAIDLKRRSINFQLAAPHDITPSVDPA